VRLSELAKRQGIELGVLFGAAGVGEGLPADVVTTTDLELKYAGYFERERVQAARVRRLGDLILSPDLDYSEMKSLSIEARQKLASARPATLAQATRLSGISPSDLQNLVIELSRRQRVEAG
jgi:tRNA uridine 5-carboxymethylaminomethyl modification enzyme